MIGYRSLLRLYDQLEAHYRGHKVLTEKELDDLHWVMARLEWKVDTVAGYHDRIMRTAPWAHTGQPSACDTTGGTDGS